MDTKPFLGARHTLYIKTFIPYDFLLTNVQHSGTVFSFELTMHNYLSFKSYAIVDMILFIFKECALMPVS
jgi:hypothetical protein